MAQKLSVTIALEGGAEIERQLAGIGEAGMKAFADIQKAAEEVGGFKNLKPEVVTAELQKMGVTGVDALQKIQQAVQSATRLESVVQGVKNVEAAFAACTTAAELLGATIGLAVAGIIAGLPFVISQMRSFGQEIVKVNAEAQKVGLSIEKFDQLRISLEAAGISAKGLSAALGGVKESLDKAALDRVAKDLKTAKETWNISGAGVQELNRLYATAKQIGPAGKAAAEGLQELGIGIPGTTAKDVEELGTELAKLKGLTGIDFKFDDTVATRTQKLVAALQQIPDVVQRAAIAQQFFKDGSAEFSQAMQTGSLSVDNFKTSVDANSQAINQKMVDLASRAEQSVNRMGSAFDRFNVSGVTAEIVTLGSLFVEVIVDIVGGAWQVFMDKTAAARERIGEFFRSLSEVVTTPVNNAWQWVVDTFTTMIQDALNFGKQLVTDFVTTPIAGAWQWIVDKWNAMLAALGIGGGGGSAAPASGGGGAGGGSPAGQGFASGGLLGGRGTGTSDSNLAWVSRGEYIMPARAVAQPGVLAFLEALRGGRRGYAQGGVIPGYAAGGVVDVSGPTLLATLRSIGDNLVKASEAMGKIADTVNKTLAQILKGIFEKFKSLADSINDSADGVDNILVDAAKKLGRIIETIQGKASGGLLGGRGSGTSDSNLAWVSRGEYITPASAVAQPGVLAFLEALRRSGGNLRNVLDGMSHFALGGMVRGPISIPAFAGGGMNNVTINFPGLPEITGLRASSGVVDELRKAAALAQVRSGGRKPSRFS